jgi:hypothetical protein
VPSQFVVPSDQELSETLGVVPEDGDEVGVRSIRLPMGDGSSLRITTDVPGLSVLIEAAQPDRMNLRLFREGATDMRVAQSPPQVIFTFRTDDTTGQLSLRWGPSLEIVETSLLT